MTEENFTDRLLRMQPQMLNYALILTSNRDEDYNLLQQTTLEALDHRSELPSQESFPGWARSMMKKVYAASDHAEHHSHHVTLALAERTGTDVPEQSLTPSEVAQKLARLDGSVRKVVEMWLTGYTREEISVKLHMPSKTVSVYIRQIK